MYKELLVQDEGVVRVLTLDRPGSRNALSGELAAALYEALIALDRDDSVASAVLTAADPAFCAGVDLKEAARQGESYFRRLHARNPIDLVAAVTKPVIGAVNGPAITGGLELALGCDFLVCSERAIFADTHVRVGVLPGSGLTVRLPALVGPAWARRMSMTGELVSAAQAERIGLVTEVVPHDRLLSRAVELAQAAAEAAGPTVRSLKRMYVEGAERATGPSRAVADEIAKSHRPDFDGLEQRRIEVSERNRARLSTSL
jgi:enoyl-CoA hydratase